MDKITFFKLRKIKINSISTDNNKIIKMNIKIQNKKDRIINDAIKQGITVEELRNREKNRKINSIKVAEIRKTEEINRAEEIKKVKEIKKTLQIKKIMDEEIRKNILIKKAKEAEIRRAIENKLAEEIRIAKEIKMVEDSKKAEIARKDESKKVEAFLSDILNLIKEVKIIT